MVALVITGRLFYLQVINHKFYQAQDLGQQVGLRQVQGERGQIFFQNSKESHGVEGSGDSKALAINKDRWLVSAVPQKVQDKKKAAEALSAIIGEPAADVLLKLQSQNSYVVLKKDVSDQEVKAVKNSNVEGVAVENIPGRQYPQGSMLAQVVGFLGGEGQGQYGLEGQYDTVLAGKQGIVEERRSINLIDAKTPPDINGSDLYLTIDYNIQFQAEALLAQAHKDIDIDAGQIIVVKPDSGRILALANFPSFNVNQYAQQQNLDVFQNSATQKLFEPGSVFKPFTMAMALEEGKVTPQTTFTDTGSVTIGPDTVRNFDRKIYGQQTLSGILEKSINTGAVFLERQLPHDTFVSYLEKLGFNEKTGVDLQGEVSSQNEQFKHGADFIFATASFGQGIDMTPLQLVRAFCVFANNGRIPRPYVAEKITHGQDEEVAQPAVSRQIISQKTVSDVTNMLINVVDRGFGSGAKIPGYYLAGKTGTAQVPFKDKKGYYPDRTVQSFIGFGPALKPQFLILVKLDNPKVSRSSLSAVPVFKKLTQYIIDYWQIPPDYTK